MRGELRFLISILAVAAIVVAIYFVVLIAMAFVGDSGQPGEPNPYMETPWHPGLFALVALATIGVILLGSLYKTRVWELARELGVPQEIIERPPSAGLWPGQTDEGEMGITYRELDQVLAAIEAGDTSTVEPATLDKVRGMIARSEHKRAMRPVSRVDEE